MFSSLLILSSSLGFAASHLPADPADYLKHVKPVLAARCYACHGALKQKGDLRVDTAKSLVEAGVVIPGKSSASPLIQHVLGVEGASRMPPRSEGEALSPAQIAAIEHWIDAGAPLPREEKADPDPREHWSFRPPVRHQLPAPDPRFVVLNTVDAFLADGWRKQGLTPQHAADKRLLLRRLTLDLTGLPPTTRDIDAFLNDDSPRAYEHVVDRLLESPQYGEHWGRHFLDIWRYSDWWGLGAELRNSQKHIWHWRDWVVENLNADTGYDEMIRQMLAADELYPTDLSKLRATGYLARPYFLFNRTSWLDEVIEHTGKGFLGLTFNCAKCHDHKFDAIRQDDYYRLRAFFEPYQVRTDMAPGQVDFAQDGIPRAFDCNLDAPTYKHERGDERRPITKAPLTPGLPALLAFADFKIQPRELPRKGYRPEARSYVAEAYRVQAEARLKRAGDERNQTKTELTEKRLAAAEAELQSILARARADAAATPDKALIAAAAKAEALTALAEAEVALCESEAAPAANKANAKKKQEEAKRALARARTAILNLGEKYTPLPGASKAAESNLETEASRAKPFPSSTTGRRTALARWIADRRNPLTARVLVNHVWARHFGKPLVATVFDFGRKGAAPTHPELLDWLSCELMEHGWSIKHLHRLIVTSAAYQMASSAQIESASDSISKSIRIDPENRYLWHQNPTRMEAQSVRDSLLLLGGKLDLSLGGAPVPIDRQDGSLRRSLYFFQSHNDHNRFLSQFDDAGVLECYRRSESIVPQQALALSNSKLVLDMIVPMVEKIQKAVPGASDKEFVAQAFRLILGSSPRPFEMQACLDAMTSWKAQVQAGSGESDATRVRSDLVRALLNHNDFITIR
jgi:mono/diheme cytochrome c family protein